MTTTTTPKTEINLGYEPSPRQLVFHESEATVRGYGGAMGGGKSRAICEEVFINALKYPGLEALICRQTRTSLQNTTKKTFMTQTIPDQRLIVKTRESQGEDWVQFWNGSKVHFVGLDNPIRWFSSEIGMLAFDEAHEIDEDDVTLLMSRLRQRCLACTKTTEYDENGKILPCAHMPHRVVIAFNPGNPGHWLQEWFINDASEDGQGNTYKERLVLEGADGSVGDAQFIRALPTDNPHLSQSYIDNFLKSMKPLMRRRYLEGRWEYLSQRCYFSLEALGEYEQRVTPPKFNCVSEGEIGNAKQKLRLRPVKDGDYGPWAVWKVPVKESTDPKTGRTLPAHRYVVSVDVSSGGASDYSGIQVIDVEDFAQVARYQGKIPPDKLAVECYRIAKIYNDALVAPEITGGWGVTILTELKRLRYGRIYTRRVKDRISDRFTDVLGWDTTMKSRYVMLDTLERVLREGEFELRDSRTLHELFNFVRDEKTDRPAAQPGTHDDLTIALAVAVQVTTQLPRLNRRVKEVPYQPRSALTGV